MKLHSWFDLEKLKSELPELPWEKRTRLIGLGIKESDAEVYVNDPKLSNYFEQVIAGKEKDFAQTASNYLTSDLLGLLAKNPELNYPSAENFAKLIQMNVDEKLNSRGVKDILAIITATDTDPETVANEKGLIQQNDEGALRASAQKAVDANPNVVAEYKAGKEQLLMFFVGQIMKETKGSANPAIVQKILKDILL
jgi:aspartyl-tRNA(Asn)/glutamyl-tRNA(Gln) amidotransferase subunit B